MHNTQSDAVASRAKLKTDDYIKSLKGEYGRVHRKVLKGSVPNPSDRPIFVKVQAKDRHFLGQKYEQNSSFCD